MENARFVAPDAFGRARVTVVDDARGAEPDPVLSFAFDVLRGSATVAAADAALLRCARARCDERVRAFRMMHAVPLVVVIADGTRADCVRVLEAGADDALCEPYDALELLARLRAVLRRTRRAGAPGTLRAGDLELDYARGEVRRNGAVIALSPTEFNVLACLARNAGRPVAAAELAHAVWGETTRRTAALVPTYVKYVRDKLAQGSRPAPIRTYRGRGYELTSEPG